MAAKAGHGQFAPGELQRMLEDGELRDHEAAALRKQLDNLPDTPAN